MSPQFFFSFGERKQRLNMFHNNENDLGAGIQIKNCYFYKKKIKEHLLRIQQNSNNFCNKKHYNIQEQTDDD